MTIRTSRGFGLRARILSLAVVPILGLLCVLVIENLTSGRLSRAELSYDEQREFVAQTIKLRSDVAAMRIAADSFRQTREEKSEAAFREARTAAQRTVSQLRAGAAGAAAKPHADVAAYFSTFAGGFEGMVAATDRIGRKNGDGLLGAVALSALKLKGIVGPMESDFGMWAGNFRDTLHELFIAERDFRVFQTNAFIIHFEKVAESLERIVDVAALKPAARKELAGGLSEYVARFNDWADAAQASETIFNRFAAGHIVLGRELDKLQAAFDQGMLLARAEQGAVAGSQRAWVIGAFAAVVVLSAIIAFAIGMRISRDARALSGAMRNLATGDTTAAIPAIGRRDEIGAMAEALGVLRDGVIARQRLETDQATASGDRLRRAQAIEGTIRTFEGSVGGALASLHEASGTMAQVSRELDAVAVEAEAQAISAAGDTEKAAAEIESAAVAAQELSSSVDEVAAQAVRSDEAAAAALKEADRAKAVMTRMLAQAERVGEIVDVISSIAAQTNLLALNATIEAARAGETGRGFAVVAAEVKELANQTSAATGEIAGQISGIRDASRGVMEAVEAMNVTIAEVSRIAGSVAAAVEEQSTSLGGISRNIVAASEGAVRGAGGIRTVESAVADTTRNASRVREISEQVSRDAAALNERVGWFLSEVRAA